MLLQLRLVHVCEHKNSKKKKKKKLKTQKIVADLKVYSGPGIRVPRFLSCPGSYIYENQGSLGSFFPKKNIKNSNFRQGLRLPNFRCLSFFDEGLRHTQIHIYHQIWKPLCLRHVDWILSTAANAMDRFKV